MEQNLWSECSRFLTNCVVHYNACILSELLEYAERENHYELADKLKRVSPVSWKHVNFYGEYMFREIDTAIDLMPIINQLASLENELPNTSVLFVKSAKLDFSRF